ncbi:hypothetical protein MTsPCn9_19640 [Croceitalea sp. MTPC9]|uniref:hypothetical protein n=1 Tax=unclassified Croceitalea TaxID=2632280 RepID=UPI002B3E77D3|nr:hypothetical protein MTsPCn6_12490 [Croceitalea sp. MTPC6]GMN17028.1 hypothetical protein MTsPCn9_19640 [Croceitalea sp. MTPC9]
MIKLFRRIRKRLLRENKFKTYLFYAIGEIALVVIGILIALYLDNLNEQKVLDKKQENHLRLIKGEMTNNLNSLQTERKALGKILMSNRLIISLLHNQKKIDTLSEHYLSDILFMPLTRHIKFDNENGALTELLTSAGLKDIKNDTIRGVLASWDAKLSIFQSQEAGLYKSFNVAHNLVREKGSFRVIFDQLGLSENLEISEALNTETNKHFLTSKEFENIMLDYLATGDQLYRKYYPSYQKDLEELIKNIDQELSPNK